MSERYIELHIIVCDDDNNELPEYEDRICSMQVPEDWSIDRVRDEVKEIFEASARIMEAP